MPLTAQVPPKDAKFVKGTCNIPAKTMGYFYPVPWGIEGYVLQTSPDESWFSLQVRDSGKKVLFQLQGIALNDGPTLLSEGSYVEVRYVRSWVGQEERYIATEISRREQPIIEGTVDKLKRESDETMSFTLGDEGVNVTNKTNWLNLKPSELLTGQRVIVVTAMRTRTYHEDLGYFESFAKSIEVNDADNVSIQTVIHQIDRNSARLQFSSFPFPIQLSQAQLSGYEESKHKAANVHAHRQTDGKWVATDVSFLEKLPVEGIVETESVILEPIFTWDSPSRNVWPLESIYFDEATKRLMFTYRRERKYKPFWWFVTFGLLSAPRRNIMDVELDRGEPNSEFCQFELGGERLDTTLNELRKHWFKDIK